MARLLILLAVLAGLYFAFTWYIKQPRKTRLQVAAIVAGGVLIALAATGRLNWVFAVFGALLPFLRRALSLLGYLPVIQRLYRQFGNAGAAAGPTGQQSSVTTRFVKMTLDHDSGAMNGSVLEGRYAGMELQALTLDQLLELLTECDREDEESAALLRAYLDRVHGDAWRERAQPGTDREETGFAGEMTRREAYAILGLEDGASEEQIIAAHRRLMQKLHPDRGGSTYLAAKLNQAKELLLGGD